jgi:iron complex outermembrane receptor protein
MTRSDFWASTAISTLMFGVGGFNPAIAQTTPSVATTQTTSAATATAADSSNGDVLVTARRREERLIDVPISIQTLSATQLAANRITDLQTLQTAAGFTFNSQGSSFFGGGREFPSLVFRGMSSNYGAGRADSGALFIDGIYISGGSASITLADASRVEVLKGPQNVYFGKNTFGGAVNLVTAKPSEDFHGSVSAGYSDKGSYDDVASVEGAIIPGFLTGRVTGELLHQGAQYKAADGGPLGKQDTKGVTVVLYATPSPDSWLRGRFHYSHDNDSAAADGFLSGTTYGTTCPGLVNPYFCNGIPSLGSFNSKTILSGTVIPAALLSAVASNNFGGVPGLLINDVPHKNGAGLVRDNIQGSLQGGINLPYDANLQFSAGYNQQKSLDLTSSDHTPNNVFTTALPFITHDIDFDVRLVSNTSKPLRFVVGANYFRSIYKLTYDGDFFGVFANSGPTNEKDKTSAVYASAEYDIFPSLTLTGEVRYQKDTISDSALDGQPAELINPVSKSYEHALPRAILKYHPTDDLSIYGSYSIGVQPPQLQTSFIEGNSFTKAALSAQTGGGSFTKDPTLHAWEFGVKKSLLDKRAFVSLAYYNQMWNNALVETFLFNDPANGCSTLPTVGVSTACPYPGSGVGAFSVSKNHIQGIEFDGTARITPELTAHAMVNWTHAVRVHYYDASWGAAFTSGSVPSQDGNRVDLVPEYQVSADATYKDHLTAEYDWYVHGVVNYTGSQYVEATDIAKISGFARVNLSAGITRGSLTFEGFVSNLFNDKHWDYAVRFPDPVFFFGEAHQGVVAGAPNPRDFGFRISEHF